MLGRALLAAGIGAMYNGLATLAQVASNGDGPAIGDIISAGGSFSAAGALVYIVKKMTDGQLVARDAARVEAQQSEQIQQYATLAAEALERERKLEAVYREAITYRREHP